MADTDVVTLAEAKLQLNMTDTVSDAELAVFISGASEAIEDYAGAVVQRTVTETLDGGRPVLLLAHTPVSSVTEVVEDGVTADADRWTVSESGVLTRLPVGMTWYDRPQSVVVTYVAGSVADTASAPRRVKLAALIIVQHMWQTQRPAGQGPFSQESDDYDPRYSYSIPRRALELLGEPVGGLA